MTSSPTSSARDPGTTSCSNRCGSGRSSTKNRFYQVPHCNGMGYRDPTAAGGDARGQGRGRLGRGLHRAGGDPSDLDITPFIELRIWDDQDMPALARIADAIHEHGALAGIELCHNGMNAPNLYAARNPNGADSTCRSRRSTIRCRRGRMDQADIADLRRWHRNAVAARAAGRFRHRSTSTPRTAFGGAMHFLSRRYNNRTDEYGGCLENRTRLLREMIEDTRRGGRRACAVACRLSVDELIGDGGLHAPRRRDVHRPMWRAPGSVGLDDAGVGELTPAPRASRRGRAGAVRRRHQAADQRSRSSASAASPRPTRWSSMVRGGVLDLIGAARPSIADPFLPKKIEEGRLDDIRECIGCNICVSGDFTSRRSAARRTRSWARNGVAAGIRSGSGASSRSPRARGRRRPGGARGGAGARQARLRRACSPRRRAELGGRVARRARLPGLAAWVRVRRLSRGSRSREMRNVEVYPREPR